MLFYPVPALTAPFPALKTPFPIKIFSNIEATKVAYNMRRNPLFLSTILLD